MDSKKKSSSSQSKTSSSTPAVDRSKDPNFDPVVTTIPISQKPSSIPQKLYVGLNYAEHHKTVPVSYSEALQIANAEQVDFVIAPFSMDSHSALWEHNTKLLLRPSDWINRIVVSMDNFEHLLETDSKLLEQYIQFIFHLNYPALLIDFPSSSQFFKCVRFINQIIHQSSSTNANTGIWLHISLDRFDTPEKLSQIWDLWNQFYHLTQLHYLLGVMISIPSKITDPSMIAILDRFIVTSPVRCITLYQKLFEKNSHGYEVLPKPLEQLLVKSFDYPNQSSQPIQYCLSYSDSSSVIRMHQPQQQQQSNFKSWSAIIDYLYFLKDEVYLNRTNAVEQFIKPYYDVLQKPIQPLEDNLDAQTYEVFERDPVKYKLYEEATRVALLDIIEQEYALQTDKEEKIIPVLQIMVLGAGRGPLVKAAFRALTLVKEKLQKEIPFKISIIEKNPNALVILNHWKATIWREHVSQGNLQVIDSDLRDWNCYPRAHILISELLGSFGDNELSPDLLQMACAKLLQSRVRHQDALDGICIPVEYTSYIAPLQSSKFFANVMQLSRVGAVGSGDSPVMIDKKLFETAYVCMVKKGEELDHPKPVFTFRHEASDTKVDSMTRYTALQFTNQKEASYLHGFVGYFECKLYKNVLMSILPSSFSKGMFSWFPIVFPIYEPIAIAKGSPIEVHFWRHSYAKKVWYEWCLSKPTTQPIQNVNGRSYEMRK